MNRKIASWLTIVILLLFIGYCIYDLAFDRPPKTVQPTSKDYSDESDQWVVTGIIDPAAGKVRAVAIMENGNIIIGGENFITCYDQAKSLLWTKKLDKAVTSLAAYGDTIFASSIETIMELDVKGEQMNEWGPFEDNSIITSVSANKAHLVYADAGNKIIVVMDRKGNFTSMIGKTEEPFIIPSPYFDVAIDRNNIIYVANTGNRRIERRDITGKLLGFFGEPGTAPGAFCGCCNPAHFSLIPGGFITAEKGINRIKILNTQGEFVEFVSSVNNFTPSLPLDIASADGKFIYAANPADSKVYIFKKKL